MDASFSNYVDWETAISVNIFKETFKVMESKQKENQQADFFFPQKKKCYFEKQWQQTNLFWKTKIATWVEACVNEITYRDFNPRTHQIDQAFQREDFNWSLVTLENPSHKTQPGWL